MAKAKIPVSFSKSKSSPTSDLNSIINDMAIKQLKTKPDFKSIYDEYSKYSPEPSQPKLQRGLEQIPEDVSKGMEEGGPLGAIGGAIKGILGYVNTTEGMRLLSAVDQDPLRQNFYQTRAKQLQESDNNKITAYNDQVSKRKEDISKLFGDYAKHNQTTEQDILKAAAEINKQEDQQVFTAGENALNREQKSEEIELQKARDAQNRMYQNSQLGIELQKIVNDKNKSRVDKDLKVRQEFGNFIQKDQVLQDLLKDRKKLKGIEATVTNPSQNIAATQIPKIINRLNDTGPVSNYEQKASAEFGNKWQRMKQSVSLGLNGTYDQQSIKDIVQYLQFIQNDTNKQIKNRINGQKEFIKTIYKESDDKDLDSIANSALNSLEADEEKNNKNNKKPSIGKEVKSTKSNVTEEYNF